jgi:hypothetical protein
MVCGTIIRALEDATHAWSDRPEMIWIGQGLARNGVSLYYSEMAN